MSLADRFRYFVPSFTAGPAPLYAHLAERAADELEARTGPFFWTLRQYEEERPERFLPLRLLAAVHRDVLSGWLPELAEHYPSAGGTRGPEGAWPLFRAAVIERRDQLPHLLAGPLQHNEVTRAAALAGGFLYLSGEGGLPLRLLEVGASAGLLLRWDRYLHCPWFAQMFESGEPDVDGLVQVVERRGCDLHPIDPATPAGALLLRSFVWADLAGHVRILDEAIEIAREVPVIVDAADGADWLPRHATPRPGVLTVVYHSLMRASGPPESLPRMTEALLRAAEAATTEAPLAYLRFEAPPDVRPSEEGSRRLVEVQLTTWPGAEEVLLATADVNGRHVRWLA